MFKDKVYDDLDDISKLVEPYQYKLNEEIVQFPDEIEVTPEMILKCYDRSWGWSGINTDGIVTSKAEELGLMELRKDYDTKNTFFEIQVKDKEDDEEITIDFETGKMSHRIFVVKVKDIYDDADLAKKARHNIVGTIKNELWNARRVNKPRLNELADLYGAEEVKKDRSYKGKVRKFCNHLEGLMDDLKLDIRDIELSKKFGEWIVSYVKDGNLAALNNVTRIKIITHKNRPIYSIEERSTK
jgi:hypothetical protein